MPASPDQKIAGAPNETRWAHRRRVLQGGKVVSRDGAHSINCTIRDLSETGARIELPRATLVPLVFYLLSSRHAAAYEARVVWRNATQAGLKFGPVLELSPHMASDKLFLWRLFLELCPRSSRDLA